MANLFKLTETQYQDHVDQDDGFCLECNDFTRDGDTEPDAEEYPCPSCENDACVGTAKALILDLLEIIDEEN